MQAVTVELGPRQVELMLKSIDIVKRTLVEFEDEEESSIDTTEELSRITTILLRAQEKYSQTAQDVQLALY